MILLDTGPLVALFDPNDQAHDACVYRFAGLQDAALRTTMPVLTEAFHFLTSRRGRPEPLRRLIADGQIVVRFGDDAELLRAFELQEQYADLPMDFADASLVAAAETLDTTRVFTLDRRDFTTYRIRRGHRLVPVEIV